MATDEQPLTPPDISQPDFECTPYEDADFEVIGESRTEPVFEPLALNRHSLNAMAVDVMFADFGGRSDPEAGVRWHLPEGVGYISARAREEQQETARREAEKLAAQLEAARQEGFEKGRLEAYEEAVTANASKLLSLQERSTTLFHDLGTQYKEQLSVIEREAVKLAIAISEKLVGAAVEINPEYLIGLVNEAIKLSGTAQIKKVRISPADMEFVEVVGIGHQLKDYDESWKFEADPSIRSGCVMETSAGEIDLRIDAAWERIKENVMRVVR